MYISNDAQKKEQYGNQVTHLRHASEQMKEANKLIKNQSDKVVEMVSFINDVVGNKYNQAVKVGTLSLSTLSLSTQKLAECDYFCLWLKFGWLIIFFSVFISLESFIFSHHGKGASCQNINPSSYS